MHLSLKKAEKVVSIHNTFTVTMARDMHLKLVIKLIQFPVKKSQVYNYIISKDRQ